MSPEEVTQGSIGRERSTAAKLAVARRAADFPDRLDDALDELIVRLSDYPQLRDLAWNRTDEYIPAREAFQLYERNWVRRAWPPRPGGTGVDQPAKGKIRRWCDQCLSTAGPTTDSLAAH